MTNFALNLKKLWGGLVFASCFISLGTQASSTNHSNNTPPSSCVGFLQNSTQRGKEQPPLVTPTTDAPTNNHSFAPSLETHEYDLFTADSHPNKNYTDIVDHGLITGDILRFSDGQAFEYIRTLGHGHTTSVLAARLLPRKYKNKEISDTERAQFPMVALRVPLADRKVKNREVHLSIFINSYIEGHDLLYKHRLPIPDIIRYHDSQYVAVEYIDFDFNGNDFFKRPETIDPVLLAEAEEALVTFARSTAQFELIGDFNAGQMAYSIKNKTWYLLDWTDNHALHLLKEKDDRNGRPRKQNLQRAKPRKKNVEHTLTVFDDLFMRSLSYPQDDRVTEDVRELTQREKDIIHRLNEAIYSERKTPTADRRNLPQRFFDFLGWRRK